jgi:hypothetical protein
MEPRVWEYDDVSFIAAKVLSRALAAALHPGEAQVLPLGEFHLTLSTVIAEHPAMGVLPTSDPQQAAVWTALQGKREIQDAATKTCT